MSIPTPDGSSPTTASPPTPIPASAPAPTSAGSSPTPTPAPAGNPPTTASWGSDANKRRYAEEAAAAELEPEARPVVLKDERT
ncbi:hypothetical protein CF319_g8774, partial [Tilletia indica]